MLLFGNDDYSYSNSRTLEKSEHLYTNLEDFRAKSAIFFYLFFLLSSYQCQSFKCLLLVFFFAVIISCVYFVRRGLHISWYNLLCNTSIVYVQKILLRLTLKCCFS